MRDGKGPPVVHLMGMSLARVRQEQVLDRMFSDLDDGRGGWVVTVNLDMLRRHHRDAGARALYAEAELRIADGMPLVWASRLMGPTGLPERVAGSSLALRIAERAARERRALCLLGGAPGAAQQARRALGERYPGLRVVEAGSPTLPLPPSPDGVRRLVQRITPMAPDILMVGLGSPKQEYWIRALRPHFPATWMIGVGVTFSFLGGQIRRAPRWMQRTGLEWTHRLAQEPRRLARRYLVEDLPFAMTLLRQAARQRLRPRP